MPKRDIIGIGASAGGVEALRKVVAGLPADLPAAVLVTMHLPSLGYNFLPKVLSDAGPLQAVEAEDGDAVRPGCIYVAAADHHLLVGRGRLHLVRGPREGRQRPAINVTFRSIAMNYRERAIGVVLTGMLDDGTAGLWEIKNRGGLAVVQDPEDAVFPGMPVSALQDVVVDHRVRADEMGQLLGRLTSETSDGVTQSFGTPPTSHFSGVTCPDCRGPIFEIDRDGLVEFQCRVGHRYSPLSLLGEHTAAQERKLYEAVLALDEGADLSEYLAPRSHESERSRLIGDAEELRRHAQSVREMIQGRKDAVPS